MTGFQGYLFSRSGLFAAIRKLLPTIWVSAFALATIALWLGLNADVVDRVQGHGVKLLYVHVPSAYMATLIYLALGICAALAQIWRLRLPDLAFSAMILPGCGFCALALITDAVWGKPAWGTWWVWSDARLVSTAILFLLYLGLLTAQQLYGFSAKARQAIRLLAIVGCINLPVIKFSVDWWTTQHQGASLLRASGPAIDGVFLIPLLLMMLAFSLYALAVIVMRIEVQLLRYRLTALSLHAQ